MDFYADVSEFTRGRRWTRNEKRRRDERQNEMRLTQAQKAQRLANYREGQTPADIASQYDMSERDLLIAVESFRDFNDLPAEDMKPSRLLDIFRSRGGRWQGKRNGPVVPNHQNHLVAGDKVQVKSGSQWIKGTFVSTSYGTATIKLPSGKTMTTPITTVSLERSKVFGNSRRSRKLSAAEVAAIRADRERRDAFTREHVNYHKVNELRKQLEREAHLREFEEAVIALAKDDERLELNRRNAAAAWRVRHG
jgi:hypothetical protein